MVRTLSRALRSTDTRLARQNTQARPATPLAVHVVAASVVTYGRGRPNWTRYSSVPLVLSRLEEDPSPALRAPSPHCRGRSGKNRRFTTHLEEHHLPAFGQPLPTSEGRRTAAPRVRDERVAHATRDTRQASLKWSYRAATLRMLVLFVPSHFLAVTDHDFPKNEIKIKFWKKTLVYGGQNVADEFHANMVPIKRRNS